MTSKACKLKQYEGKAKRVTDRSNGLVEICFRDDITAFNGGKHAVLAGKGAVNSQIYELMYNFSTHCWCQQSHDESH